MADAVDVPAPVANRATARPRLRSLRPRFGIRTLLIAGVVASLLFGWLGRNLYRVRQEDAAIEAILQAGAGIGQHELDWDYSATEAALKASRHDDLSSQIARALGLGDRPKLRFVILQEGTAEPRKLRAAAKMLHWLPEIEHITLGGACFDDEDCRALSGMPRLATLGLRDTNVGGAGVAALASDSSLTDLTISDPHSAGALDGVSRLTQLRRLTVFNSYISSDQMLSIASLPRLETLQLVAVVSRDSDALGPLADATSVKELYLDERLAETDLRAIGDLPNLKRLDLPIGGEWDLVPLTKLRRLKELNLRGDASKDAVRALSAALPDCEISWELDDGTRLTVRNGRFAGENESDDVAACRAPSADE